MPDLTDTEVNEACARFCGWKPSLLELNSPNYLHSPEAADELMRALQQKKIQVTVYNLGGIFAETWECKLFSTVWNWKSDAPDWKEALARAVAQLQITKEAHA